MTRHFNSTKPEIPADKSISRESLCRFCYDNFPHVYEQIRPGWSRDQIINLLVGTARQTGQIDRLPALIKTHSLSLNKKPGAQFHAAPNATSTQETNSSKMKIRSGVSIILSAIIFLAICYGAFIFLPRISDIFTRFSPTLTPSPAIVYQFQVRSSGNNQEVRDAKITLDILGSSHERFTDSEGVARFFLHPSAVGQLAFLIITASSFCIWRLTDGHWVEL